MNTKHPQRAKKILSPPPAIDKLLNRGAGLSASSSKLN
jgi:hypothetical protein